MNSNIVIITFTVGDAAVTPLSNLINIINRINDNNYLIITSESNKEIQDGIDLNKITQFKIKHKGGGNPFFRVCNVFITQLRILYVLVKISRHVDVVMFFLGGESLILPVVVSKIFNKRVLILLAASHDIMSEINKDYLSIFTRWLTKFSFLLSDYIVVYSYLLIGQWNLKNYENKIRIANEHYLNFDRFKMKSDIRNRSNLIGYVGRLSPEKGIMNFIESIPLILAKKKDLKFIIIGDGKLKEKIKIQLKSQNLNKNVILINWVDHDKLPYYLNKLKLIIIPSYTEGLPNVMLESMACGVPVICSPVGIMPELIEDEINGFMMQDNSPKSIEENIIRALEFTDLEKIVFNARSLVERNYNFETAFDRYKSIFDEFH